MENKKIKQVLPSGWSQWEWGGYKEKVQEGNMVKILCTHAWKWENEACWNYSKHGGEGRIKENYGGDEFK
jgi:hypothetical protein